MCHDTYSSLFFYFLLAHQLPVGQGLLNHEVPRFHTHNDVPQPVGLLWTSGQLVPETSTWQNASLKTDIHEPMGFEPTISTDERPQTYALERGATGTGIFIPSLHKYYKLTLIIQYKTPLTSINCPVRYKIQNCCLVLGQVKWSNFALLNQDLLSSVSWEPMKDTPFINVFKTRWV